jgi:hypothetical protein
VIDADRLAAVAVELAVRVRDDDPEANGRWLAAQLPDPADWFRLTFVLAAAVPDDRPWATLTAWTGRPLKSAEWSGLKPCGTRAAYRRHRRHGETPCQPCRAAAAAYKRQYRRTPA